MNIDRHFHSFFKVKRNSQGLLFALTTLLSFGCQRTTLSVITGPEKATVAIMDPESGVAKIVGQTPFTINDKTDLPPAIKDARVWNIRIDKKGHVTEHILLDRSGASTFKISSNLKRSTDWISEDNQIVGEMADNIGRMLKTVYLQINTRDYVKALKTIDDLIEDFPKSAIFYDIKGSIHVLRGEKNLAKGSYQKSLSLNANSPETKAALDRL